MVYKMSEREIEMRSMANAKAARLNSIPRPKEDMGRTVATPVPIAAAKKPVKKKAKHRRSK